MRQRDDLIIAAGVIVAAIGLFLIHVIYGPGI